MSLTKVACRRKILLMMLRLLSDPQITNARWPIACAPLHSKPVFLHYPPPLVSVGVSYKLFNLIPAKRQREKEEFDFETGTQEGAPDICLAILSAVRHRFGRLPPSKCSLHEGHLTMRSSATQASQIQ